MEINEQNEPQYAEISNQSTDYVAEWSNKTSKLEKQ